MACRQAWSRLATATQPLARRALAQPTTSSSALRHLARARPGMPTLSQAVPSPAPVRFVRLAHNIPRPVRTVDATTEPASAEPPRSPQPYDPVPEQQLDKIRKYNDDISSQRGLAPHYELTFTCKPCGTRSSHNVSKQGYHHGSVLIACPACRNRHVISDHLGIFDSLTGVDGAKGRTVEDILREKGQLVKKGTLGEDGDIEFWEDGSTTERSTRLAMEDVLLPRKADRPATGTAAAPGSTFQTAKKA